MRCRGVAVPRCRDVAERRAAACRAARCQRRGCAPLGAAQQRAGQRPHLRALLLLLLLRLPGLAVVPALLDALQRAGHHLQELGELQLACRGRGAGGAGRQGGGGAGPLSAAARAAGQQRRGGCCTGGAGAGEPAGAAARRSPEPSLSTSASSCFISARLTLRPSSCGAAQQAAGRVGTRNAGHRPAPRSHGGGPGQAPRQPAACRLPPAATPAACWPHLERVVQLLGVDGARAVRVHELEALFQLLLLLLAQLGPQHLRGWPYPARGTARGGGGGAAEQAGRAAARPPCRAS